MILNFIISTSVFFLFLVLVSVRSFRQTRRPAGRLLFSAEAGMAEEGGEATAVIKDGRADIRAEEAGAGGPAVADEGADAGEDEYKENIYKGILWMKEKYEQYRDLADERYERLKEQMVRLEKKYENLLASKSPEKLPGIRGAAGPEEPMVVREIAESGESTGIRGSAGTEKSMAVRASARLEEPTAVRASAGPEQRAAVAPEPGAFMPDAGAEVGMVIVESPAGYDIEARVRELEEQFAHERQRLEEETARLRHALDEEVIRSRRQLEEQAADARRELELHMQHSNRQLEEKQRIIGELEGQLRSDRQKIEELVAKLRHNSQLLLNIYKELDKSFQTGEEP